MVRLVADGEQRYRLEDANGNPIGWIRRRAVGFGGFRSESDATVAAIDGWRALESVLRREYTGWPRFKPALDALHLVHDGAYTWISDGRTPVARLVRPTADAPADSPFAIEFVLPSYASEGVVIAAAQVIARVLRDHAQRRVVPPAFAGQPPPRLTVVATYTGTPSDRWPSETVVPSRRSGTGIA
jgi:hypothetical protein